MFMIIYRKFLEQRMNGDVKHIPAPVHSLDWLYGESCSHKVISIVATPTDHQQALVLPNDKYQTTLKQTRSEHTLLNHLQTTQNCKVKEQELNINKHFVTYKGLCVVLFYSRFFNCSVRYWSHTAWPNSSSFLKNALKPQKH